MGVYLSVVIPLYNESDRLPSILKQLFCFLESHFKNRFEILLVDDSPGDVRLGQEAFKDGKFRNNVGVVGVGVEAMAYLRQLLRFEVRQ